MEYSFDWRGEPCTGVHWDSVETNDDTWMVQDRETGTTIEIQEGKYGNESWLCTDVLKDRVVCVYPGRIVSQSDFDKKMKSEDLSPGQKSNCLRYVAQHMLAYYDTGRPHYLDPTDAKGNVDEAFLNCPALYINESDKSQKPNVFALWNDDSHRMELRARHAIKAPCLLLVSYGGTYVRDYATVSEDAIESRTYLQRNGKRMFV